MREVWPISGTTRLVGVMGDPIRHSKSPAMLNAAFGHADLDWRMLAMPVASGDAAAAVAGLRALGIEGCSVTMPHKAEVMASLDGSSPTATKLRAVNCIRREGENLVGENTDGLGFLRGLAHDTGFDPVAKNCVVIGAGGAARAVVLALGDAGASDVRVVNRSPERAKHAADLAGVAGAVDSLECVSRADLIVQATPVGMHEKDASVVPSELMGPDQVLVDLIYHPATTPTMLAARAAGAVAVNGLSMLIHQAGVAFEHWTGREAPIEAMRAASDS